MPRDINETDMSEMEREFELEMGEESEPEEEQLEEEFEALEEEEPEEEKEFEEELGRYSDRFYQLSKREFESEAEVDAEINSLLTRMEHEYFWGKLKKLAKKAIKKGTRYAIKRARKYAKGLPIFQGLKGITQLARGNLKGVLGTLAKAGLGAALRAHPAGAAILPALQALGFKETTDPEENREAWDNFVDVSREAFEYLAENIDEKVDDPSKASQLATDAFQTALRKTHIKVPGVPSRGKRHQIIARKGDIITIEVV